MVQDVVKFQPVMFPFSKPPLVTMLFVQVAAQKIGVGDWVKVIVGDPVRVELIVYVRLTVFVFHGVQVRESDGGQVIEGVGDNGTAQQIETSAKLMYQFPFGSRQSGMLFPLTPGIP